MSSLLGTHMTFNCMLINRWSDVQTRHSCLNHTPPDLLGVVVDKVWTREFTDELVYRNKICDDSDKIWIYGGFLV